MVGSGRAFRGGRLRLIACVSAVALVPGVAAAGPDGSLVLAQAGTMSNQPRTERSAAPPPASIAQPPAPAVPTAKVAPTAAAPAPAAPFALAETPGGYTARNLAFRVGPSSYIIPTADIRGTNLLKEEIASLLDPGSAVPLADRVGRLAASEIVIPELRAETIVAGVRQTASYRDIRLSDIGSGRIAAASAASGSFDAASPEGPSRGTFARTEMSEVDLGLMIALLNGGNSGSPEMRRMYGSFSMEGMITDGPKGARARIARFAGRDFKAKPIAGGWLAAINALPAQTDLNKASPEERSRVVSTMADLLDSFEIGSMEATGIEFTDSNAKDATGRISRIGFTGGSSGSEFRIEGVDIDGKDGRVRVANFSIGGMSLGPMLGAARDLAGKTDLSPADMRRLVPAIGSVRLSGIEVDTKGDAQKREAPMQFSLGLLELLGGKPVENIPTDIRLTLRNLSIPVAAAAKDASTKRLAQLGYERIDVSMAANLGWNEPGQELVIRELSAEGAGMGRLLMRGVIGNVTRDAFSPDEALAAIAWTSATARSLEVAVQNTGLFERLLGMQAAEKKRSVDDLRREYGMTAAVGIPVMLGNAPAAKALGQAVARFIAKPGQLTVQARARDAAGLGVADVVSAPDPVSLLDKVELSAAAE